MDSWFLFQFQGFNVCLEPSAAPKPWASKQAENGMVLVNHQAALLNSFRKYTVSSCLVYKCLYIKIHCITLYNCLSFALRYSSMILPGFPFLAFCHSQHLRQVTSNCGCNIQPEKWCIWANELHPKHQNDPKEQPYHWNRAANACFCDLFIMNSSKIPMAGSKDQT
jgi:hypothetical protein